MAADAALLFFGLVWAALGRSLGTPEGAPPRRLPPPSPPEAPPPPPAPPPGTLPPTFPGPAWEYDEPPPVAVQQRAKALLSELWSRGEGAYTSAMTDGRWITYRAEIVRSGKKGVVAYRVRSGAAAAAAPARAAARAPAPRARPARAPRARPPTTAAAPRPKRRVKVDVGPARVQPAIIPVSTSPALPAPPDQATALPVLRYGAGLKPQPPNPDVRLLQQRLGITPDGQFGSGTRESVRAFQRRKGLAIDGVVGPETWRALFAP